MTAETIPPRTPDEIYADLSTATVDLVTALESGDTAAVVRAREAESDLWSELLTVVRSTATPAWVIFTVSSALADSTLALSHARQRLHTERTSHA